MNPRASTPQAMILSVLVAGIAHRGPADRQAAVCGLIETAAATLFV
jgi:hypothetical protein